MKTTAPQAPISLPARRIAWSALRDQFEANLRCFDARAGLGEAVRAVWRDSVARLQLLRFDDGSQRVLSQLPDSPGWLPCGCEPSADATKLRAAWGGRVIRTLAVNGVGLGGVASAVISASRETFLDFSPRVLIVEPSLLAWAVVLHLRDWGDALDHDRVRLCAGPSAIADFDNLLRDTERLTPLLISSGAAWPGSPVDADVAARIRAAEDERRAAQGDLFARVSAAGATRSRAAWAERYASALGAGRSLTILGITSRFTTVLQYTMRDLLSAFATAGHATHLLVEADANAQFSPLRALQTIERERPDLIILLDHTAQEFAGIVPPSIPVVTWIQDQLPHLFNVEAGAGIQPLEFVIGHGFPECLTRFGYPPERFLPSGIPTNVHSLLDDHETADDLAPFRCDVMFATNATMTPGQLFDRFRSRAPQAAAPLLASAYEELLGLLRTEWFCGDYDYGALLVRCEHTTGREITHAALRAETINALRGIADQALRERVVSWAAEWADATGGRLHLYGRGWDERREFARFARGFVPHGPLLGRAFRAAKVSLHAGVNSALHQRVIDGLCAGGFFLIAEKPFDVSHAASCAILDYYKLRRPPLPFRMRPDLLSEPHATTYRRSMHLRGVDPAIGDLNAADDLLNLRLYCEHGMMFTASAIWPRYADVIFHGREQFIARLSNFVSDDDRRRAIAQQLRAAVLERFTYDALVKRLLHFVRDGLAGRTPSLLSEL